MWMHIDQSSDSPVFVSEKYTKEFLETNKNFVFNVTENNGN
uniref:Uncharacterized protein n=1 Tax=Arundo donax TaxID=35708 RepID=A0A0A9G2M9_ARUDO